MLDALQSSARLDSHERRSRDCEDRRDEAGGGQLDYVPPDIEIKLAGMLSPFVPRHESSVETTGYITTAYPEAKNWRIRKIGDKAPEHVRANPKLWGEPGGLDDLLDRVTDARRDASQKAYNEAHSEDIKARDRARYKGPRADSVKAISRVWKETNSASERLRTLTRDSVDYHRPFVIIDSEGCDRAGNDIVRKGIIRPDGARENDVTYPDHGTFLWGAQAWIRDNPGTGNNDHSGNRGHNGPALWLGDESKRFLTATEIFDWLLELPAVCGNANFGIFSGGYDFGQVLHTRGMPRHTIWEICKSLKFKEADDDSDPEEVRGYTWWHPYGSPRHYGIKYLKGKFFSICLLDPNNPGKGGKSNYLTKTTIYDVFGFFQSPLLKVVKSLVKNGYAEQWEYDLIEKNKALRTPPFSNEPFENIKEYCGLELSCTSRAMTLLRDGFDKMGIRLKQWSGAGSAAGAMITKMELKKRHFPADIRTLRDRLTKQQTWAHAATHAGRIELLQQGYAPNQKLYGIDVVSAYPHGCLELPSMRDGKWENKVPALHKIPQANILSMYKVTWRFPEYVVKRGVIVPFRFFPLPYRSKKLHGAILYPAAGCGIYMRDDVVGAMKWIEAAGLPPQPCNDYVFIVEEAMEFHPGNDEMPFKGDNAMDHGLEDFYEERRRIKEANPFDVAELNIKLTLNSLSGKFGQKIGGNGFEAPPTANPWYYATITASCRRRVLEAVLTEPGAITDPELAVGFMTDGIVTTRPLEKLERVKGEGDRKELGDWEAKTIVGGMYLQSGYYTHIDADSRETITKLRGARKAFIVGAGDQAEMHDMLLDKVLPEWQKPRDPANFLKRDTDWPAIDIEQKTYITPGTAVASKERWKIGGRWAVLKRRSNIHTIGTKRILDQSQPWLYWSCNGMPPESLEGIPDKILRNWRAWCEQYGLEAVRCRKLVPSLPARNPTPDIPSEPAWPKWMAGDDDANDGEGVEGAGGKEEENDRIDDLREQADIAEGI